MTQALHCESTVDATLTTDALENITDAVSHALNNPLDFPAWTSAIVPGDHVVLAVDPSVPQITEVIAGIVQVALNADVGKIDVVLWDEATEETVKAVRAELPEASRVVRHRGEDRREVRYLAADEQADPIYLNRLMVDADLVLPVVASRIFHRASRSEEMEDISGVFPLLADSSSRMRYQASRSSLTSVSPNNAPAGLLGVQLILSIVPNQAGEVARVLASDSLGISKELENQHPTDATIHADLVIALLSGGSSMQTWHNLVRAIVAATADKERDPTIVLWTDLETSLDVIVPDSVDDGGHEGDWDAEGEPELASEEVDTPTEAGPSSDEDFPAWNPNGPAVEFLKRIDGEYRVFLRSRLASELVETTGLAPIHSLDELARLSEGFEHARILPAAQFLAAAVLPGVDSGVQR